MTEQPTLEAKQYFQVLRLIHAALIAGVAIFMGVCFFLHRTDLHLLLTSDMPFFLVAVAMTASLLPLSFVVHIPLLKTLKPGASLSQVQQVYQTMCLVRWSMMEASALFSLVAFFVTSNLVFVVLALVNLAVLVLKRPATEEFIAYFRAHGTEG